MFRPLSAAILIQLIAAIASVYNWRAVFRCIDILRVFFALLILLVIRRRPEDIGLLPDGDEEKAKNSLSLYRLPPIGRKAVICLGHFYSA